MVLKKKKLKKTKKQKTKPKMESFAFEDSKPRFHYGFNLSQECGLLKVSLKFPHLH